MTRRTWVAFAGSLALVAIAIGVVAFWNRGPSIVPSIVLITVDTLRADRLGSYGHPTNHTPAIDRLAHEGMLFESAYCDVPWTTGSMASVMTGQYSSHHGVQLPTMKLKDDAVTMAEILRGRGYQTGAIIGSFPLDSVYGLDQGFDTYDDRFSLPIIASPDVLPRHVESRSPDTPEGQGKFITEKWRNDAYRSDEEVTEAAIGWLERTRDGRPFLLWVHYFGPHEKLRDDIGFLDQEPSIIAAYDGDVEKADVAVGRLIARLESLDLLDKTAVILHADHGQNLGESGFVGHGMTLDEVSVRIPLVMRYPRLIRPGLRRVDVVRNVDILPTVLALAGAEAPGLAGRSLLPSWMDPRGGRVAAAEQVAYFGTLLPTMVQIPIAVPPYAAVLGPIRRSGLRTPEWKFLSDEVVGPCVEGVGPKRNGFGTWTIPGGVPLEASRCQQMRVTSLHAIAASHVDGSDVSGKHPELVVAMKALLDKYAGQEPELSTPMKLSPEAEEKLRSLGYIR